MADDIETVKSTLAAIEVAEQRTSKAVFFWISSSMLILWGSVTAFGYLVTQFDPTHAGWLWPALQSAGFLATAALLRAKGHALTISQRRLGWRLIGAEFVLIVFGMAVIHVLGPFDARQLDAFWPLLFMLSYVLIGLWFSPFFIVCGAFVAVLVVAGFYLCGPWYCLWLALTNGGGLIAGGLWLRGRGAAL